MRHQIIEFKFNSTILITACNTNKKETKEVVGFVINGEVDGIPDQKVYLKLVVSEDMSVQQFDPVEIVNGKFKFEGKLINPPALVVFSFEDDRILSIGAVKIKKETIVKVVTNYTTTI